MTTNNFAMIELLGKIERLLRIQNKEALTSAECALLLDISQGQVRKLTMRGELPHYKRGGKNYYSKKEIQDWMLQNKVLSKYEMNNIVLTQFNNKQAK